jgi:hypothetical protein
MPTENYPTKLSSNGPTNAGELIPGSFAGRCQKVGVCFKSARGENLPQFPPLMVSCLTPREPRRLRHPLDWVITTNYQPRLCAHRQA